MGILNRLPVFKKCCFCIPLRIGVTIVGYWSLFVLLIIIGFNINAMGNMTMEGNGGPNLARVYMFRTLNVILILVYIILSVMLLIGARKRKPEYLRHFFVSSLVMTVANIVIVGLGFMYLRHWVLSIFILWIATNVYSLLIVRSYFLAMEEKERGSRPRCEPEEVCWDTMQLADV